MLARIQRRSSRLDPVPILGFLKSRMYAMKERIAKVILHCCLGLYHTALAGLRLLPRRRLPEHAARSILLTGTFYSDNWAVNKLLPLAASDRCRCLWIVCTHPMPTIPKVRAICPPRFLRRMLGDTPARLTVFIWMALRYRPEVVGGFHIMVNGLLAIPLARCIGARSMYFCCGGPNEVLGGGYLNNVPVFRLLKKPDRFLEARLIAAVKQADVVIAKGNRAVQFFQEHGVQTRFEVIAGGIDQRRYTHSNGEGKTFDLIAVTRLDPVKRLDVFLRAIQDLKERKHPVSAVIVGEGQMEMALKDLAKDLGVSDLVTFAGYQSDVTQWLRKAKVFVLTSDNEGLSLAAIEAMMCGLPAVVSDVGEMSDLVKHGVNGFVVRERSSKTFAQHLNTLLTDDALRKQFSAEAHRSAARLGKEQMTAIWDRLLLQL
jgi:glycosyltransferase involved in cell wall biosynthesis